MGSVQSKFLKAVKEGNCKIVKRMLRLGADVNAVEGRYKKTALHFAARQRDVDVVKVLLQNGADVNAVNKDKWTALHYVAQKGHVDIAKVLIQNGADLNALIIQTTALHDAATKGMLTL